MMTRERPVTLAELEEGIWFTGNQVRLLEELHLAHPAGVVVPRRRRPTVIKLIRKRCLHVVRSNDREALVRLTDPIGIRMAQWASELQDRRAERRARTAGASSSSTSARTLEGARPCPECGCTVGKPCRLLLGDGESLAWCVPAGVFRLRTCSAHTATAGVRTVL